MAENKEYYVQALENGFVQISEDVVASVAAMAVLEVEGVYGLSGNLGADLAEMLGKKNLTKGVRLSGGKEEDLSIECDVVAKMGASVFELAQNVQQAVKSAVESTTGLKVAGVNVNISGVSVAREARK